MTQPIPSKWEWISHACRHHKAFLAAWYADRIEDSLRELYTNTSTKLWTEYLHDYPRLKDTTKASLDSIASTAANTYFCVACIATYRPHFPGAFGLRDLYCKECKFGALHGICTNEDSLYHKFANELERFTHESLRSKDTQTLIYVTTRQQP
jgi:hypothetical protein